MKLLANENFPLDSVKLLRKLGYEIKSIGEDYPSISDKEVMSIAQNENRIILTFDRDYGELIFKYNLKPEDGVIYLRLKEYQQADPAIIIDKLLKMEEFITKHTLTVFDGNTIRQRKY